MTVYLIKVNNLYYGKENSTNGRILNIPYYPDENLLMYTVKEIAYKTKQAAIKAAQKLQKEKPNAKISIQGLIFNN